MKQLMAFQESLGSFLIPPVQIDLITLRNENLILLFDYLEISEVKVMTIMDKGLFDILNRLKDQ